MLRFTDLNRRDFLQVGSLAGLSLPMLLQAQARGAETGRQLTTGKSVIFLMMHGGPSQIETFDPKMDRPANNRSATGELATSVPGLTFGGTFPKLARRADRLAIVRSYTSGTGNHDIKPVVSRDSLNANIGSIYSRVVGALRSNGLPSNCLIVPSSVDPQGPALRDRFGNFASSGALGSSYSPFVPGAGGLMQQNMRLNMARDRVDDRRALLGQLDRLRRQTEADLSLSSVDRLHEQAFDVILNGVSEAFSLSHEDRRLVEHYDTASLDRPASWAHKNNKGNYTANARSLGKLLLLARRLCELGCGFVTVNTEFVWDMHQDQNNLGVNEGMDYVGSPFDHAVSTLIDDLEARGLSDKILLVATGEMGRTPTLQANGGRNHWGKLTPLLLHGGGLTHGQVIGHSSRDGGEPASTPVTPRHVIGTIMHTLFNVGDVRLTQGIPSDVMRLITEYPTIPGLSHA